jgi:hypothetical protein
VEWTRGIELAKIGEKQGEHDFDCATLVAQSSDANKGSIPAKFLGSLLNGSALTGSHRTICTEEISLTVYRAVPCARDSIKFVAPRGKIGRVCFAKISR